MNYLQLCQRVRQDAGVSGDGPSAVTGQVGILARIVEWVKRANYDIQLERQDWSFLWASASGSTIANVASYLPADLGISSVRRIKAMLVDGDSVTLRDYSWYVTDVLQKGATSATGKPTDLIAKPDGNYLLFPIPDKIYPVHSEYYKRPVAITVNTDTPAIPEEYHEAIIAKALMYYADYEEDGYMYQKKQLEYATWLKRLSSTQKPKMEFS